MIHHVYNEYNVQIDQGFEMIDVVPDEEKDGEGAKD